MLKEGDKTPVYAVVAPSLATQVPSVGKAVTALKQLGFAKVFEAALGADMVSDAEAKELAEKGFLTSSCCPTFVSFIKKNFPAFKENISHNLSPMATVSKFIKEAEPSCKIIFIGPCIAKKKEIQLDSVKPYVDLTLTFEEIQAIVDAKGIAPLTELEETPLDQASFYGRIFARAGGLSDAVKQALSEQGSDFEVKPLAVDGLDGCRTALIRAKSPNRDFNFIEGMGCAGGCIGGPCCLTHEVRDKAEVDRYGHQASAPTIKDAIKGAKGV